MCKNIGNTISKDDLYSGLRTIYTVIIAIIPRLLEDYFAFPESIL